MSTPPSDTNLAPPLTTGGQRCHKACAARPSSPFGLRPHCDKGRALHFRLEVERLDMLRRLSFLVFISFATTVFGTQGYAQVPEIPNPNLGDIAMVTNDYAGRPIIIFNPIICQQVGSYLCEFYKAHEYGHVNLGHTTFNRKFPQAAEAEADCWAAQRAPLFAVQAAIQWFSSGGGASYHHGTGSQRAQRVIACALNRISGN